VTGVEVVLAALAAGAGAGLKGAATSAVTDAYASLRDRLGARLTGRTRVLQVLADPPSDEEMLKDELQGALVASGAGQDQAVLAAALWLLALVDPQGSQAGRYQVYAPGAKGVQVGDHNTQTNTFT